MRSDKDNIRINYITEQDGYIAAYIENDEIIYSAFDTMVEEAYYTLLDIICLVENFDENIRLCSEELSDYIEFFNEFIGYWTAEYVYPNGEEFKYFGEGETYEEAMVDLMYYIAEFNDRENEETENNNGENEKTKNVGEIMVDIKINVDDSDIDKANKKITELANLLDKVNEKINVIQYPTYHPPYKYYITNKTNEFFYK